MVVFGLWLWEQPSTERFAPVGEYVCQHLSRYAGRTLQSRSPTNLPDKRCHPPVRNISGWWKRAVNYTKYYSSSCPCSPPLCFDAACLGCHISVSRWLFSFMGSISCENSHSQKNILVISIMGLLCQWRAMWLKSNCLWESLLCFCFGKNLHSTCRLFHILQPDSLPLKFVLKQCQLREKNKKIRKRKLAMLNSLPLPLHSNEHSPLVLMK